MAAEFTVASRSATVEAMAAPWPMIDALVGGTAAMRAAGKTYLPQWPMEGDETYKARLAQAVLFPAFAHSSAVLASKPFARPISVALDSGAGLPNELEELLDDVDMFGTDLHPFAAGLFLACMRHGLVGVLVDMPMADGVRTRADEKRAGIRPYFTIYPAASILGWRVTRRPTGEEGLSLAQLRLMEAVTEDDGDFGEKEIAQVRVLEPGRWRTYRKAKTETGEEKWTLFEEGRTSLDRIPFVFFYGIRKGFGIGAPPLLDLAHMNVEHWQTSSDQQSILHVARVPILFAKGFSDTDTLVIGASTATRSTAQEADLRYVEHTGAAIEAGRQSILDLEDRMRQTGAELLVQRPNTVTARQVTVESEGGRSTLQLIAEDFEESLEQCIDLLGAWKGIEIDSEVQLFKDFGAANLSERGGDLLLRAADAGHLSSETAFENLKRMDVLPHDASWDVEKLRLAAMPKPTPDGAGEVPPAKE